MTHQDPPQTPNTEPASPAKTGIITLAWLREQDVCEDHLDIFQRLHGEQSKPTRESLLRSVQGGLDLRWLAKKMFTAEPWRVWQEATAEPRRVWQEAAAEAFWLAYTEQFKEETY